MARPSIFAFASLAGLALIGALSFLPTTSLHAAEDDEATIITAAIERPRAQAQLESVLDDLLQGRSDFKQMETTLRANLLGKPGLISSLSIRLQSLGDVKEVSFAGTDHNAEVYDVFFAKGEALWTVATSADGRLKSFSWEFQ